MSAASGAQLSRRGSGSKASATEALELRSPLSSRLSVAEIQGAAPQRRGVTRPTASPVSSAAANGQSSSSSPLSGVPCSESPKDSAAAASAKSRGQDSSSSTKVTNEKCFPSRVTRQSLLFLHLLPR